VIFLSSILDIKDVTKIYGGVIALNHVSLSLEKGEILALVGENGAGKSTLIKTLSGAVIPDKGVINFEGKEYSEMNPALARELGIAVVYQELNLCPSLTVYENIFLGSFEGKAGFLDKKTMKEKAAQLLKENNIDIDPGIQVSRLSVAHMQLVEIAKAVMKKVKVLVLDEPTGTLTSKETKILFGLMRRLKEQGTSIIYISHRMSEIFEICERVTIMRDGNVIETRKVSETTETDLIKGMIGREFTKTYPTKSTQIGETILKVENLYGEKTHNVSFELHSGEILGFGGLVGAGRTETMRILFGADAKYSGRITLNGKEITLKTPRAAVKAGISLVPEDRKGQGVVLGLPISNNICLSIYSRISKLLIVNRNKEKNTVDKMIKDLKIKTPSAKLLAGNLSGGNQQKVVLGKCLSAESKVLILDEPTRGIDVGAKFEFYKLICELAEQGIGILMVSSEMDELLGMSDRIIVMSEGNQTGILEKSEFTQQRVMELAAVR